MDAEGWFLDPFGRHEQRWFSAGVPTGLVRDGAVEASDEPPAAAYDGPLERPPEGAVAGGGDLRRADEAEATMTGDVPYRQRALDVVAEFIPPS